MIRVRLDENGIIEGKNSKEKHREHRISFRYWAAYNGNQAV